MDFLESSGVRHARTVFVICAFIVIFFLLVPESERTLLAGPIKNEGHWGAIISVALLILVFPILASMSGWNLNTKPVVKSKVEKVVILEGMKDKEDSFCSNFKDKPMELETQCEQLSSNSQDTCTSVECCGWLTVQKDNNLHSHCVAVDESGFPVFSHNKDGTKREMVGLDTKIKADFKAMDEGVTAGIKDVFAETKKLL